MVEISRLNAFIRAVAEKKSADLGSVKNFLKGEAYFIQKYVGKKPVAGLYTDEEMPLLTQNWASKTQMIKDVYRDIPKTFAELGPSGISEYLKKFNIETPSKIKSIEEAKMKRIPMLIVISGRGKGQSKEIAKGGNLPEKLINIDGGDNVRTIGRVMYSPNLGVNMNYFTDLAMRQVNSLLDRDRKMTYLDSRIADLASWNTPEAGAELAVLESIMSQVQQAAQVYLEVIPNRRGNPSWDAAFPHSKK